MRFRKPLGRTVMLSNWRTWRANGSTVLREADEPDWNDPDKVYSEEVRREMQRIERNEATVMVFPVYWWSMPALLKGWIDRVWNNGWAYGARKFPQKRAWMIGIAGAVESGYSKRGYDAAIRPSSTSGSWTTAASPSGGCSCSTARSKGTIIPHKS
jgi:putative NADPH-quinone reductase